MRLLLILAAPLALAACATNSEVAEQRAAEGEEKLAEALEGYTPAGTRNCLPARTSGSVRAFDNGTLLVRHLGTIYRSDAGIGCAEAGQIHKTLVTNSPQGNMCAGDIARVVDLQSGMFFGSCSIAEWTEYKRASAD